MISIQLNPSEIAEATAVAIARQKENLELGRRPRYGALVTGGLQLQIDGVLGEFAAAKALGIQWRPTALGDCDLPGGWEVRTSTSHKNRLILHPGDDDWSRFIFVTVSRGEYRAHGWILGEDGKNESWWMDPTGQERWAYFVPRHRLHPMPTS